MIWVWGQAWAASIALPGSQDTTQWTEALALAELDLALSQHTADISLIQDKSGWALLVQGDPTRKVPVDGPHSEKDREEIAILAGSLIRSFAQANEPDRVSPPPRPTIEAPQPASPEPKPAPLPPHQKPSPPSPGEVIQQKATFEELSSDPPKLKKLTFAPLDVSVDLGFRPGFSPAVGSRLGIDALALQGTGAVGYFISGAPFRDSGDLARVEYAQLSSGVFLRNDFTRSFALETQMGMSYRSYRRNWDPVLNAFLPVAEVGLRVQAAGRSWIRVGTQVDMGQTVLQDADGSTTLMMPIQFTVGLAIKLNPS